MSAAAERAIRTIAVAGAGIAGLSAAIAFARALPRTKVTIVALPPDPSALADRMPASLPAIHRFHAAIGLDELELVRGGVATHHLGTRFEGWSESGETWIHAFGSYGQPANGISFDRVWARARAAGRALPYHAYSPAAALAASGKFVHPSADSTSLLSTFLYALRLDPGRYRERLEAQARSAGVAMLGGELVGVGRNGADGLSAMILADGQRVEADLFVDCSGPSAKLRAAIGEAFEDWGGFMPADRVLLGSEGAPDVPATADEAEATDIGWMGSWPLRGRRLRGLVYSSATPEDEARRAFGLGEAEALSIRPGSRPRPWLGNVLAVGDAAVALDPLGSLNLDLAQHSILLALELPPGRDCHPLETAEYNRRFGQATERARDFAALHYLRSGRQSGGGFWARAAAGETPASLARTLDQYHARGRLPFYEEDNLTRDSWTAVLLGMGVVPRTTDPLALAVPFEESVAAMERLAKEVVKLPGKLPEYRDYLQRAATAGARSSVG